MIRPMIRTFTAAIALLMMAGAAQAVPPVTREADLTLPSFTFKSGETLTDVRLHYTTLGTPHRDARGHVDNAVLILHGTGGTGAQFMRPQFADVLFQPGGLLDPARYFIILPDDIGHGRSSKPSDGLHARFPHYDYDDMVELERRVVADGLQVDHLRLILGTSMGCMHAFVWGEAHPSFADGLMPLACLPVELAGRNRLWRRMAIDAIQADPGYQGGDYSQEPQAGLRTAADLLMIAGSAPIQMQKSWPDRASVDKALAEQTEHQLATLDANDLIYQLDASRTYNPAPDLEKITAPVLWINSADDFINPPDLGIAEREARRLPHGQFILIPASLDTHGHGTHTWAAVWQDQMRDFLARTAPR